MHKIKFLWPIVIFLFVIISRFYNLAEPTAYVFDEQYHIPAANLSLNNDLHFYEWWHGADSSGFCADWLHPPLFKYLQAGSMKVFGQTAFAWRFPSVVFGIAVVMLVYLLAKELFGVRVLQSQISQAQADSDNHKICVSSNNLALLSASFASLSGLLLVQSRVGMNDIVVSFFIVLLFYLYVYGKNHQKKMIWNLWLALAAGLAIAIKWSAGFAIILIFCWEVLSVVKKKKWTHLPWLIFCFIILPSFIYLLSFWQIFEQGKDLSYLGKLHQQIIWYQFNRDSDHPEASKPIQWFFNLGKITYWQETQTVENETDKAIFLFGNPVWQWLAVLAVLNLTANFFGKNKKLDKSSKLLLFFYLATWLPWIFSPRIMFYYHYTPAIPFLSIILARMLLLSWQKKLGKWLITLILVLCFISFLIYYPLWIGISYS